MPTKIPYVDEAWSPITGCSGDRCKCRENCWARRMVDRFPKMHDVGTGFSTPIFHLDRLNIPYKWRKPRTVLVSAMGDLFDSKVGSLAHRTILDAMDDCHQHRFLVLTKQASNMMRTMELWGMGKSLPDNIWPGVSCCDQEDVNRIAPELFKFPCKHRWISLEPLLAPVRLWNWIPDERLIRYAPRSLLSWVVVGCESGPGRRPCKIEWVRAIVRDCREGGIPVYVKQLDIGGRVSHDPAEWPEELRVQEIPS